MTSSAVEAAIQAWMNEREGFGLRAERVPDGAMPWIRAAAQIAATQAQRRALEEAARVAETPATWRYRPNDPDCDRIAAAIRALMEREEPGP